MTPAQMIADLDEALARVGSTVALRKTNTTTGQVTVKARVRFYAPAEIAGIIEQGDSKVVLSPTGLGLSECRRKAGSWSPLTARRGASLRQRRSMWPTRLFASSYR
jgi:hypothetical protein